MTRVKLRQRNGQVFNVTLDEEVGETTGAWYGISDEMEFMGKQRFPKSILTLIEDEPKSDVELLR